MNRVSPTSLQDQRQFCPAPTDSRLRGLVQFRFPHRFFMVGLCVFGLGILAGGMWFAQQIERSAVNRAAAIAAAYTESILSTELSGTPLTPDLPDELIFRLDRIFVSGALARKVVRFKLWAPDGTILYSNDSAQRGARYTVQGPLNDAFQGRVMSRLTRLDQPDNVAERAHWPRLLEVYVPIRTDDASTVAAVAEFYHATDNLEREIRAAQRRGWMIFGLAAAIIGFLLHRLFNRADATITDQARDLQLQLNQLQSALVENERIRSELRQAGERTTALNESFLHRIAADLHDGPAQQIAFALMRFDDTCCREAKPYRCEDLDPIRNALQSSLGEIRGIAAGLGVPRIETLSLDQVVRRSVHDFERQYGLCVILAVDELPTKASLALKITLYRFIQECLSNARRHAAGVTPEVSARLVGDELVLEVSDDGDGFAPGKNVDEKRFGLAFLEERVRLVGGKFAIRTAPGAGATIAARFSVDEATRL
jgi:signal transduction histidine kinase